MSTVNKTQTSNPHDGVGFEAFLATIAARFVNLEPKEVDDAIEDVERQVCEFLGLDLAALWQWCESNPNVLALTHLYRRFDGPFVPPDLDAKESFPWTLGEILAGRTVRLARLEDAPPEARVDLESWRHFELASILVIPLAAGAEPIVGIMSFHTTCEGREWSDEMTQRLQLVAQVFTNALIRKQSEMALRRSEARLQLAAESAQVGMWELDVASGVFWANNRARELFRFGPGTEITMDRFLDRVHADDRERVEAVVEDAVETGARIDVEYRVVLPDGGERWVRSQGRTQPTSPDQGSRLLGASLDITERKRSELLQRDRLDFETMLADLSRSVLGAPTGEIDTAIEKAQRRVCEILDIELSALWQWSPDDPGTQVLSHLFRSVDGPPIPEKLDAREHFPWSLERMVAGRIVALDSIDDAPPEAATSKESWLRFGVKSTLILPLAAGRGPVIGSLSFNALNKPRSWPEDLVRRLRLVAEIFANALKRKHSEEQIRKSLDEVERLQSRLELENAYLKREVHLRHGRGRIVGESPAILEVLSLAEQVAATEASVLIQGETGTGKELVARRVHELGSRSHRPLVTVNCAALPSTLVESELFGREKGAYTGAVSREAGRFEIADGATLLLDEVAELPVELQPKLLRVLEEGEFERVGSPKTLKTDVRIIAATNRNLETEVEAGRFRGDLYFRLAVFPIVVPPLRERRDDIPLLVWSIVEEFGRAMNKVVESIRQSDMDRLMRYDWPGNVRELRNVVERALILSADSVLRIEPPVGSSGSGVIDNDRGHSLEEVQRRHIVRVLETVAGRVGGPGGAAELLDMKPTTLRSRMRRLGLDPKELRDEKS